MNKNVSIVKVDNRPYKKIAQENWGLTDKQMQNMHVHHRLPVSKGGTDDPCNLYICSAWFHKNVWHAEDGFNSLIPYAQEGGRKGGRKGGPTSGRLSFENQKGIFGITPEEKRIAIVKGGRTTFELGIGCHAPEHKGKGAMTTNSILWEDPNHPELGILQAGPLARRQKKWGLPHGPENRRRVKSL